MGFISNSDCPSAVCITVCCSNCPSFPGCTCNSAGVHPAMCPGGDAACLCDPATGACPCLPNVLGATCDQCASGYWDLASGEGCQTCDCDPKNSQSNQCNQVRKLLCFPGVLTWQSGDPLINEDCFLSHSLKTKNSLEVCSWCNHTVSH